MRSTLAGSVSAGGYAIQLSTSLLSVFSFKRHKLGTVNFPCSMVLAVITDFWGFFNKSIFSGASEGDGIEAVSASEDGIGKREIVVRLMVSSSSDIW
jgi:hypothetical protein